MSLLLLSMCDLTSCRLRRQKIALGLEGSSRTCACVLFVPWAACISKENSQMLYATVALLGRFWDLKTGRWFKTLISILFSVGYCMTVEVSFSVIEGVISFLVPYRNGSLTSCTSSIFGSFGQFKQVKFSIKWI